MTRLPIRDWGFLAALVALVLDQATKIVMLYGLHFREMASGAAVPVLPFFNLVMVWNRGISYGLFPWAGPMVLSTFTILVVVVLGWWLWGSRRLALAVGLGLVIGGAVGNLVDRLVYGRVADFFHFYYHDYGWYVFNVADCAITVGVFALLYDALLRPEHGHAPQRPSPGASDAE